MSNVVDVWFDSIRSCDIHMFMPLPSLPQSIGVPAAKSQVELPILGNLHAKGVVLETVEESLIPPMGLNQDARGNFVMNRLGMAFRKWCRKQKIERPPPTWNLHLIGRGDNDSKSAYPVLDSNIKAAHTKPILFFLSHLATEISDLCKCSPIASILDIYSLVVKPRY